MLPNAPYVFTRCSGSNEEFMSWPGESMLRIGLTLSTATRPTTATVARRWRGRRGRGAGAAIGSHANQRSSSVGIARTIVSQFSHERLPLAMSTDWNAIVTRPAPAAIGCGAK